MSSRRAQVRAALERELGAPVEGWDERRCGGGSINAAARIQVAGRTFFLKWNDRGLERHFAAESAGLAALASADSGFVVPRVISCADGPEAFLLLEDLGDGHPRPDHDEAFGRFLARLHRQSAPDGFGFDGDGYCGATPQPNAWSASWVDFYRERRLLHQLRLAESRGLRDTTPLYALIEGLDRWVDEPARSSLIHGDLWSGNAHVDSRGRPAILDPAAYYAHREAELGMMSLFGGFGARVWESYDESFPLDDGWRERLPIYELYHVLNHYVLFGGGYGVQALRIAARYAS